MNDKDRNVVNIEIVLYYEFASKSAINRSASLINIISSHLPQYRCWLDLLQYCGSSESQPDFEELPRQSFKFANLGIAANFLSTNHAQIKHPCMLLVVPKRNAVDRTLHNRLCFRSDKLPVIGDSLGRKQRARVITIAMDISGIGRATELTEELLGESGLNPDCIYGFATTNDIWTTMGGLVYGSMPLHPLPATVEREERTWMSGSIDIHRTIRSVYPYNLLNTAVIRRIEQAGNLNEFKACFADWTACPLGAIAKLSNTGPLCGMIENAVHIEQKREAAIRIAQASGVYLLQS